MIFLSHNESTITLYITHITTKTLFCLLPCFCSLQAEVLHKASLFLKNKTKQKNIKTFPASIENVFDHIYLYLSSVRHILEIFSSMSALYVQLVGVGGVQRCLVSDQKHDTDERTCSVWRKKKIIIYYYHCLQAA